MKAAKRTNAAKWFTTAIILLVNIVADTLSKYIQTKSEQPPD